MKDKAKEARNAYMREYMKKYKKKHPEKVKKWIDDYWERKGESLIDNREENKRSLI